MPILRITLLVLLSLRLLGGDGGVLQVVAWAGMLVSRSAEVGVSAAVESTFDGEHPCALCTAIQKSETPPAQEAPLPESLLAKLKLKDILRSSDLLLPPPFSLEDNGPQTPTRQEPQTARTRRDAPPVPPPQSGMV